MVLPRGIGSPGFVPSELRRGSPRLRHDSLVLCARVHVRERLVEWLVIKKMFVTFFCPHPAQ